MTRLPNKLSGSMSASHGSMKIANHLKVLFLSSPKATNDVHHPYVGHVFAFVMFTDGKPDIIIDLPNPEN
jgi:hypothetical protein